MKAILRRTLIVLWLAAIAGVVGAVFESGVLDGDTWIIAALLVLPVWALQFILTGLVNPASLLRGSAKSAEE